MTKEQGFYTAFYFLHKWYEVTKSDELGILLGMMEPLGDGIPADPSMMEYWEEAYEKMLKDGKPPAKKLS